MSLTLTPILDLLLSLTCVYYGLRLLREEQDMLAVGYLMVSMAAFIGFFDLGGMVNFKWIHDFLSAVSRLIGTLAMGLGVIALLAGQRRQRYAGYILALSGPVITYYFYVIFRGPIEGLYLWAGCIFLLSILALAIKLWQRGHIKYSIASIAGLLLTAFVGLFSHALPQGLFLKPVDIFHISLMVSYTAVYYGVMKYAEKK